MQPSLKERGRIRSLATQVFNIASTDEMAAIKQRWRDVNALRKPDRAPVWCRPVGCWREIIPSDHLQCSNQELRSIEYSLLQTLHKHSIGDDHPVENYFAVPAAFSVKPANTWGVNIERHRPQEASGAWSYDPPLKNADDFMKLHPPAFLYDAETTRQRREKAEALLGDIMPVKVEANAILGATLGTAAADLRGLEPMMMDMIAEPDLMHRLMAFLRDAAIDALDALESAGVITPNNNGPMTCSDPIGEPVNGPCSCKNLWCMANSQEFDQVSPAMWEEFCLDYQLPIFERFGLIGYGCCENLTHKLDGVLSIPNLRILTCSAWTSLPAVLEKAGKDYCIMWRQKASDVVFCDDTHKIRNDLEEGARQLKGHYYQIVLRELETLAGHPDRLHEWTRCAKDAAEKFA